jgi:hypothetical protein
MIMKTQDVYSGVCAEMDIPYLRQFGMLSLLNFWSEIPSNPHTKSFWSIFFKLLVKFFLPS